jgi:hypothetical protein
MEEHMGKIEDKLIVAMFGSYENYEMEMVSKYLPQAPLTAEQRKQMHEAFVARLAGLSSREQTLVAVFQADGKVDDATERNSAGCCGSCGTRISN